MCTNPNRLADGSFVACRECWQCKERKIDDWSGRNIAEVRNARAAHTVTLTYGRDPDNPTVAGIDHMRAAVLTYSDVQKMLKHLRVDGYPVRYFVVGEYGDKKGRSHWHIILYWQGDIPELPDMERNRHWKYWPHGFTYWRELKRTYAGAAVRYACKYLVKVMGDENGQIFGPMPSKKPPLGDAWFRDLARQHVDAGFAPQSLFYSFPDVQRRGKPVNFLMSGKTADNFLKYYVEALTGEEMPERPKGGNKRERLEYEMALTRWVLHANSDAVRMPNSELVEEWLDGLIAPLNEAAKYREKVRDIIRAKYKDPAYGAGFNLYPKGLQNG